MVEVKERGTENKNLKPHENTSEVSIRQYENLTNVWPAEKSNVLAELNFCIQCEVASSILLLYLSMTLHFTSSAWPGTFGRSYVTIFETILG